MALSHVHGILLTVNVNYRLTLVDWALPTYVEFFMRLISFGETLLGFKIFYRCKNRGDILLKS